MILSLIAGMATNRTIGKDNKLPWDYPEDLKYFKKTTTGHTIVMGLNTYYSIGKPLPNRKNVVLSKQDIDIKGVDIYTSIPDLLKNLQTENEVFIIGGASIYKQFIPLADKIYLTQIKKNYQGDTFFPAFEDNFNEVSREKHNELDFVIYHRK